MSFWLITLRRLTGNGSFSQKFKRAPSDNKGATGLSQNRDFLLQPIGLPVRATSPTAYPGQALRRRSRFAPCRQIQGMRDPFNQHNRTVNMFDHFGVPAPSGYAWHFLKPQAAQDGRIKHTECIADACPRTDESRT